MSSSVAFALVLTSSSLAAADGSLVVEVAKKGNVTWTGDCALEITAKDPNAAPVGAAKPDVEIPLAPGDYDLMVSCPTSEGVVKKFVKQKMTTKDAKATVTLEPGFLIVFVQRFDSPVAAEVRITDPEGHELAVTKERAVVPLAQGKVRVIAKVADAKASRPVIGNADTTVVAMKKGEVTVDTTDGELTLLITNNGAKAGGVGALRIPGDTTRLVELRAGEKASVPPGTYELVTQLEDAHDFGEVVTPNVVIPPKKAISKTATHKTATVGVTVLVDGKAPPAGAKIDVELYQPGAPQPFNTVALGEKLKLKPGKIEIAAKRTDSTLDDGTALGEHKTVNVTGNTNVTFDLRVAHLDVTTTVGRKPRALEVSLRVPAAKDAKEDSGNVVAQKKTGDDGKASFGLSPARYVAYATLKAAQGEITTKKDVSLRGGNTLGLTLDLDVGTVNVQVMAKGVAVPAEVRFLEKAKDGKVAAEPMLAVPAGQEAILPPGTYALVVKRKGKETVSPDVEVKAGSVTERTVEVPE